VGKTLIPVQFMEFGSHTAQPHSRRCICNAEQRERKLRTAFLESERILYEDRLYEPSQESKALVPH